MVGGRGRLRVNPSELGIGEKRGQSHPVVHFVIRGVGENGGVEGGVEGNVRKGTSKTQRGCRYVMEVVVWRGADGVGASAMSAGVLHRRAERIDCSSDG